MNQLAAIALVLGLVAAPLQPAPTNQPAERRTFTVLIKGFQFVPETLEVQSGDTVIWKNEDIVPHTATAKSVFDSKEIGPGKSWTTVVKQKGKHPYICTYHPTMHGELVVK